MQLVGLEQRDVLDEQLRHPFAVPVRGARVVEDRPEVLRKRADALLGGLIEGRLIGLPLAFGLILGLGECAKLGVPLGFKRVDNQAVVWIDEHVTATGALGFVPGSFDLHLPQSVGLVPPRLQLCLYGQGELDGHRRHRLDQPLSHGAIDRSAWDDLAHRAAPVHPARDALVVGHEPGRAGVVTHRHPAAAYTTQHQPLQQGGALSGGRSAVV